MEKLAAPGINKPSLKPAVETEPAIRANDEHVRPDIRRHHLTAKPSATYIKPFTASRAIAVGAVSWLPLVPADGMQPIPGVPQPSNQPTTDELPAVVTLMYRTA